jgi:ornithine cyclodeaminase/alanine dehydrogenase-like protein (mu-crystallin family)
MLARAMSLPETLILTAEDARALLNPADLLPRLRKAFANYSTERSVSARRYPVVLPQTAQTGAGGMVLAPGLVQGIPAYTVKVNAKFPDAKPAIKGAILLHDLDNGDLLAILDSGHITAVRTGIAGALGVDVLARKDSSRVAVIGAGTQGRVQLTSLALVRRIVSVAVFDVVPGQAERYAGDSHKGVDCGINVAASVAEAVADADIVITCTWANDPFLFEGMVRAGTHITTLGPDSPGEAEVGADLIKKSVFVCDDRDLAIEMGTIGGVGLGKESIHAELGEVIAGIRPGRASDDQITIFGAVGLAFQDLAAAWLVYEAAKAQGRGQSFRLGG